MILLRSALHNAGVLAVGFAIAYLGAWLDRLLGIARFHATLAIAVGWLLVAAGFLLRMWATWWLYRNQMSVISLAPQGTLVTTGPYRYSRNPLYLGGNVFIFFGAALVLGSPMALAITALHLPLVDLFIRREEKQLERSFGGEWLHYRQSVRRWL